MNGEKSKTKDGVKFDGNKLLLSLIPASAHRALGEILTFGAQKYDFRNWEKGISWSRILDALKRHTLALEEGEDYDQESFKFHTAHILTNAVFLNHYYQTHPFGDDRPENPMRSKLIGLDIDGVLADFVTPFKELCGIKGDHFHWHFTYKEKEMFKKVCTDKEFWLNLKPLVDGRTLSFNPKCYITTRSIPLEWTQEWLEKNHFPCVPVHLTKGPDDKAEVAIKHGVEVFVDDKYSNYKAINRAGVVCFLMDAMHNANYDVGYKRITHLDQIFKYRINNVIHEKNSANIAEQTEKCTFRISEGPFKDGNGC